MVRMFVAFAALVAALLLGACERPGELVLKRVKMKSAVLPTCDFPKEENGRIEEIDIALNLSGKTLAVKVASPQWDAPGSWFEGCRVIDRDHWNCSVDSEGYSMWKGRLRYSSKCLLSTEVD